MLDLWQH